MSRFLKPTQFFSFSLTILVFLFFYLRKNKKTILERFYFIVSSFWLFGRGNRIQVGKMSLFWRSVICFATMSSSMAIFIGGEQDVGSPLRVAQCRATCLERVSRSHICSLFDSEGDVGDMCMLRLG